MINAQNTVRFSFQNISQNDAQRYGAVHPIKSKKINPKISLYTTPSLLGCETFHSQTLTTKPVESPALPLERVHHVHSRHGLATSVLSVGHSVSDNVLKEDLEHPSGFFVDQTADTLHASSSGQTPDGRLGDALDVITEDLAMTLGSTLSQALASLATARHCRSRNG